MPTVELISLQRNSVKTVSQPFPTKGGIYISKFSKYHLFKASWSGILTYDYNHSTWEPEAEESLSSKPTWVIVLRPCLKQIKISYLQKCNEIQYFSRPKPRLVTNRSHYYRTIIRGACSSSRVAKLLNKPVKFLLSYNERLKGPTTLCLPA